MKLPIILLLFVLLISCEDKRTLYKLKRTDYAHGGYVYHLITKDRDSIVLDIGFSKNDELRYILNFPPNRDQMIHFYEKTGGILSIVKKSPETMQTNGRAYYFYDGSGNLSSHINFLDGIKTGSATTYHDSTNRVKEVMLYNDDGELYYRKTFDQQGNHIKTEGSKD